MLLFHASGHFGILLGQYVNKVKLSYLQRPVDSIRFWWYAIPQSMNTEPPNCIPLVGVRAGSELDHLCHSRTQLYRTCTRLYLCMAGGQSQSLSIFCPFVFRQEQGACGFRFCWPFGPPYLLSFSRRTCILHFPCTLPLTLTLLLRGTRNWDKVCRGTKPDKPWA